MNHPSIDERIVAVFRQDPERVLLTDGSRALTGGELDAWTRSAAVHLLSLGVRAGDVVEICYEDPIPTILTMLAVIRSGGAYCLVPADYPEARAELIREKVSPRIRLAAGDLADLDARVGNSHSGEVELPVRGEDDLAYVIFTSGSTGDPKAVQITDRGIAYIAGQKHLYSGSVIGQLATLQFDACVYEIFGGLLNGLAVRVVDRDLLMDLDSAPDALAGIDTMFMTTQLVNLFADRRPEVFDGLSVLTFGGERVSSDHARRVAKRVSAVYHVYGPTETTVFATQHRVDPAGAGEVPIGLPLHGARHVVETVPEETAGELLIGGAGVMRGYRNDAAATESALVEIEGESYYRTGDLVETGPDGALVFVARRDRQLKVSGFRVDPTEIESIARSSSGVEQAVVLADDGRLRLFVTGRQDVATLRTHLRSVLPGYLVPVVTAVGVIPLTGNGKTDEAALLEQADEGRRRRRLVRSLLVETLGESFDADANFVELGGDSIQAMDIIWRLDEEGVRVDLASIFSAPLREVIESAR